MINILYDGPTDPVLALTGNVRSELLREHRGKGPS